MLAQISEYSPSFFLLRKREGEEREIEIYGEKNVGSSSIIKREREREKDVNIEKKRKKRETNSSEE